MCSLPSGIVPVQVIITKQQLHTYIILPRTRVCKRMFCFSLTHVEIVKRQRSQTGKERYMHRQFIPSLFTRRDLNSDRSTVKLVN
jgi:hypothetical protein